MIYYGTGVRLGSGMWRKEISPDNARWDDLYVRGHGNGLIYYKGIESQIFQCCSPMFSWRGWKQCGVVLSTLGIYHWPLFPAMTHTLNGQIINYFVCNANHDPTYKIT